MLVVSLINCGLTVSLLLALVFRFGVLCRPLLSQKGGAVERRSGVG